MKPSNLSKLSWADLLAHEEAASNAYRQDDSERNLIALERIWREQDARLGIEPGTPIADDRSNLLVSYEEPEEAPRIEADKLRTEQEDWDSFWQESYCALQQESDYQ